MIKQISKLNLIFPLVLFVSGCNLSDGKTKTNQSDASNEVTAFSGELPISPRILKGKFENGMTYIIRKNAEPQKRAELRLVINAGSILEDESQLGFAHFAEHMAFNGTEDFKKMEILEFVESIGMKFGAHLNAHTSFDETVYKLQIPTNDAKTFETGIHIMENWAHKVSFEPEEIDKERGVVIEEWRSGKGAGSRIRDKQFPVILKDSKYAERLPIGKKEILEKGSHQDLIRFYKDWYRPELMAIIAVGDFEPLEVKALFEKYFSKIPKTNNSKQRIAYTIPDNITPLISIETDPELTRTIAQIQIKQPLFEPTTYAEYKARLMHSLYIGMLNSRIAELSLKGTSPLVGGGSNFGRFIGDKSSFSLGGVVKPGQSVAAIKTLLREVNRAIQHGFTPSELARQKLNLLRIEEKAAKEIDTTNSRDYASEYVRHFMNNESIAGMDHYYQVSKAFLPEITLAQVNDLGGKWFSDTNRIMTISAPESEKTKLPNETELVALWDAVAGEKLAAYQDSKVAEYLMADLPKPGAVVSKSFDENLKVHTWVLSNGAKVLLKQTDFRKDQILFSAKSYGGTSLIDDETYEKTILASTLADYMGVEEFDLIALNKFMKGKNFRLNSNISSISESMKGNTSPEDLLHFMQMLHLKFTSPRKDEKAFNTFISRITPQIENQFKNPNGVFTEAIRQAQYGNDPRHGKFDVGVLNTQDLNASFELYQQRFANAADFNFVFVGNIDLNKMENMLNTYVASLPASDNKENWQLLASKRTKGALEVNVKKGLEQKANVTMQLYGESQWSHQESMSFYTLKSTLSTVLRERIREEKSGVYGVSVKGAFSRIPHQVYKLSISFSCDPLRVDELIAEVEKVISEFKSHPLEDKYVTNFIEQKHKRRETSLRSNSFWQSYLSKLARDDNQVLTFEQYTQLVNSMTTEKVQQAANRYLNPKDKLKAILLPENLVLAEK